MGLWQIGSGEGRRYEQWGSDECLRLRKEQLGKQEEESSKRQQERGKISPREWIEALLDQGSFVKLDPFVEYRASAFGMG